MCNKDINLSSIKSRVYGRNIRGISSPIKSYNKQAHIIFFFAIRANFIRFLLRLFHPLFRAFSQPLYGTDLIIYLKYISVYIYKVK
jgi:hypothetical protein